jgi:exosortase/archaeosortase family protein
MSGALRTAESPDVCALATGGSRPAAWRYWQRCIVVAAICGASAYFWLGDELTLPFRVWLADKCAAVVSALGENAVSEGSDLVVVGHQMRLQLTRECAGIYSLAVVVALAWSVRRPVLVRFACLAASLSIWLVVVVGRISSIALVSRGSMARFHLIHDTVWPFFSGALLSMLYCFCSRWDGRARVPQDARSLESGT